MKKGAVLLVALVALAPAAANAAPPAPPRPVAPVPPPAVRVPERAPPTLRAGLTQVHGVTVPYVAVRRGAPARFVLPESSLNDKKRQELADGRAAVQKAVGAPNEHDLRTAEIKLTPHGPKTGANPKVAGQYTDAAGKKHKVTVKFLSRASDTDTTTNAESQAFAVAVSRLAVRRHPDGTPFAGDPGDVTMPTIVRTITVPGEFTQDGKPADYRVVIEPKPDDLLDDRLGPDPSTWNRQERSAVTASMARDIALIGSDDDKAGKSSGQWKLSNPRPGSKDDEVAVKFDLDSSGDPRVLDHPDTPVDRFTTLRTGLMSRAIVGAFADPTAFGLEMRDYVRHYYKNETIDWAPALDAAERYSAIPDDAFREALLPLLKKQVAVAEPRLPEREANLLVEQRMSNALEIKNGLKKTMTGLIEDVENERSSLRAGIISKERFVNYVRDKAMAIGQFLAEKLLQKGNIHTQSAGFQRLGLVDFTKATKQDDKKSDPKKPH